MTACAYLTRRTVTCTWCHDAGES